MLLFVSFLLSLWIFLHFLLFSASLSLCIYPLSSWVFGPLLPSQNVVPLACIITEFSHSCPSYDANSKWGLGTMINAHWWPPLVLGNWWSRQDAVLIGQYILLSKVSKCAPDPSCWSTCRSRFGVLFSLFFGVGSPFFVFVALAAVMLPDLENPNLTLG